MRIPAPLRRLWKAGVWVRYHGWQKRRLDRLRIRRVRGLELVVLPGVFDPVVFRSGDFLAEVLGRAPLEPEAEVLDLGTGSGVLAVAAAARGCRVTAVDIQPAAVRCARLNAWLHGLEERIEVLEGNLFEPVAGRRFDRVLFNPPYLSGSPSREEEQAFRAPGAAGRFAAGLGNHLRPGGFALVVLSDAGRERDFLEALERAGFACRSVAEHDSISEVFRVFQISSLQGESA